MHIFLENNGALQKEVDREESTEQGPLDFGHFPSQMHVHILTGNNTL